MLQTFLASLKAGASNDSVASHRSHPRRHVDRCVVVVYGRTFPVERVLTKDR